MTASPLADLLQTWRALTGVELHYTETLPPGPPPALSVALDHEGESLGALSLNEMPPRLSPEQARGWLELCGRLLSAALGEQRVAGGLANEVALAWNQLTFLYEALKINTPLSDPWQDAQRLSCLASLVFQCRNAVIAFRDERGLVYRSTEPLDPAAVARHFEIIAQTGRVALLPARDGDPGFLGVRVPLTTAGEAVIGLIGPERGAFTAGDRQLAESLAEQMGAVMDNLTLQRELAASLRLKHELEIAAEIQAALLPAHLPQPPGMELAGVVSPAAQVGGDFYDVVELDDGALGVLVGDVAGKGIPAAMFTTLVRTELRSQLMARTTPGLALQRTNSALQPDLDRLETFATALALHLDPATREVTYASAGHTTSLRWQVAMHSPSQLQSTALPLGILPELKTSERVFTARPGDVIVLYSDGVTEAENAAGKVFGLEGLADVLFAAHPAPASAIVQAILDGVAAHRRVFPARDDATVLVIKLEQPDPAEAYRAFVLPAELDQLQQFEKLLAGVFDPPVMTPALEAWRHEVILAVTELASNIIRHAYAEMPGSRLHGLFALYADRLTVDTIDSGRPFDLPPAPPGPADPRNLPERGFGLPILYSAMDVVQYRRLPPNRSHWHLEKRLPPLP
jgi:serine phosphatase RsbU (regulator of sigma subunit)/anti-sigma regulatory factor (Ser/Thr protein kinase)